MSSFGDILAYLNAGGVLAGGLIFIWALYTEKLRFGKDFDDLEGELTTCRAEIKQLWNEKIEDKEKAAALADAYLKIREAERV